MINEAQRATFQRDGFIVLPDVFDTGDIAAMRSEADRLIALVVNVSLCSGELSPRLDAHRRGGRLVVRALQPILDLSPVFDAAARDERLLGPLGVLLGDDPVLMEERLVCRQELPRDPGLEIAEEDDASPFHTDLASFALDGYPASTLSTAIAIDAATPDNGAIRVFPGSHLRTDWPHREGWPPVLVQDAVDEASAVAVLAPAGSVTVLHAGVVRASGVNNTTTASRRLMLGHHPSSIAMAPDKRNMHLRVPARSQEERYAEMVSAGAFRPTFQM